ncbi:unnamed protein product, partial [Staurois parvus]
MICQSALVVIYAVLQLDFESYARTASGSMEFRKFQVRC